ncbi:unnamed protein product [Parnassius apollo]|uniref:(apollo) hypothetical protein n=1 Tax=Parnassius apollo TaxID=110799 RepID=A0A8S3WPN9_PARAO|nr:unnamed protein product [Parnassius apollo]
MAPKKDYKPEQMAHAIEAVRKEGQSVSAAAKRFGVPRITLHNKISGKSPMVCTMGPSTVLTTVEEDLLVKWAIASAERRFPITREQLLDSVQRIVTVQRKSTPFTANRPGKKWFSSFIKRHPILAERTAENLSSARNEVTEEQINNWFKEVDEYLAEKGLLEALKEPSRVFNADESAFFLAPKPGRVLVRRGEKHVYAASGDEKENLTVLLTANAAGTLAPPMIVFAYDRVPDRISSSVPGEWGIGKSETGWMTGETFYEFVTTIFNPWLIVKGIQKPILFFVDGHRSHLTLHLSKFCSENDIEIIALYPNSTHILQPMDISLFRPLKVYYRKPVIQWKMENSGNKLKKENFAPVFQKALKNITTDCIKNGFRGGGLHPYGPQYIDMSKLTKRNTVSDLANENQNEERSHFLQFLETEITKHFGQEKLDLFNSLYYEGRNVLENMALDEDLNLYIVWAHNKQMSISLESSSAPAALNRESSPTSDNVLYNNTCIMQENVMPTDFDDNGKVSSALDLIAPSTSALDGVSETVAFIPTPNTPSKVDEAISDAKSHNDTTSDILGSTVPSVSEMPSQETEKIPIEDTRVTIGSTVTSSIEITTSDTLARVDGSLSLAAKTPAKNTISNALGVTVPSPFKKCLFWPDNESTKKTKKKKEKLPSAVTSKAWQEYHEKKAAEKKRILEEKELKAKQRIEKKNIKEKLAKEKKGKTKSKKPKMPEISSSEDTEAEIEYIESGESEWNEETESNTYQGEILEKQNERKAMDKKEDFSTKEEKTIYYGR